MVMEPEMKTTWDMYRARFSSSTAFFEGVGDSTVLPLPANVNLNLVAVYR